MFFIIPIGSEEGVRRLPYVTIGLIIVNTIIYFITSMIFTGQINELESVHKELLEIEERFVYKIIEIDPELLQSGDINEWRERFKEGDIIPPESEYYEQWQRLYAKFEELRSGLIFERFGFTPSRFDIFRMLTSMFVHANFFHLLFNMLFLWLVGCNIEDDWSWKIFLGLYFLSGFFACLMHFIVFTQSTVPLVGASGAIAGIMGAFMIRHYKTKIRFAYFLWFFFRPYFGIFSVYAGIALPFWFIQQILGASWSSESGTAYWAHIGGFLFGAAVSSTFRFMGIEKKYIAPMVEESFEKYKVSPSMKEATRRMDSGDTAGALPLLLTLINEEPYNYDAPLMLARVYCEKGHRDDAALMYDSALEIIMRTDDMGVLFSAYEEIKEKGLLKKLSEKNMYRLAENLESGEKFNEAVELYGVYTQSYPKGRVRAKVMHRTYVIFKDKLNNARMAQEALDVLTREYPDFPITS